MTKISSYFLTLSFILVTSASSMAEADGALVAHSCQATVSCGSGTASCTANSDQVTICGKATSGRAKYCKSWFGQSQTKNHFICCDSEGKALSFSSADNLSGLPSMSQFCVGIGN